MNIKDFLIDNYIWIIAILSITIITIIGFLADKNSKNKPKKEKNNAPNEAPIQGTIQNVNNQPMNNMTGAVQYQPPVEPIQSPINNNMGMVYNNNDNNQMAQLNQNLNTPNNQVISGVNNMNIMGENQSMINNTTIPTDVNMINNPQPVETLIPNIQEAPVYQPLSEQKPNIPAQPAYNFSNNVNTMPMGGTPVVQPTIQETTIEPTPSYNQPINPSMLPENNTYGMNATPMSNYNQNIATIPTPVSTIQTPQPVNPQHIMPNSYNNVQSIPQPNVEPMSQQAPAQNQTTTPQPLNFVFGPQNNNPNM